MDKHASGMPVEQAAAELGVPVDALRLYIGAHGSPVTNSDSIAETQVSKLKDELRSRAGALRLDDLAKTALTIEWLAQAAVEVAKSADRFEDTISKLEGQVDGAKPLDITKELEPLSTRIDAIDAKSAEAAAGAVQLAGSLQGMVESQGRELDVVRSDVSGLRSDVATLRSDIASLRMAVHALEAKHHSLIGGLKAALSAEGSEPAGKARAATQGKSTASAADTTNTIDEAPVLGKNGSESLAKEAQARFENTPPKSPAKPRVSREIEYNFLLERMNFRRLDSYAKDGKDIDKLQVPTDEEIIAFLAKYELGCDSDEVEMVSVQRGEFLMIKFQRVERASGLRSWINRGRS